MKGFLTDFPGVVILEPDVFEDDRGSFSEIWNHRIFRKACTVSFDEFVQENESVSKKNVARGMHWQKPPMDQAKLVRCVSGKIYDIIFDIMPASPNFGNFVVIELSKELNNMVYIPRGYAHGFIALEDNTVVNYKVDNYFSKEHECSFNIKDIDFSKVKLEINKDDLILSAKDDAAPSFKKVNPESLLEFFMVSVKNEEPVAEEKNDNEILDKIEEHKEEIINDSNIVNGEHPAYDNAQDIPEYVNISTDELVPASEVKATSPQTEVKEEVKEENNEIKALSDGSFFIPFSQGEQAMKQFAAMGFPINLVKPEDVETNSDSN